MFLKYFTVFALLILCGACQSTQNEPVAPKIVPAVEVKRPVTTQHELGIIGAVEPIYFLPMKTPFQALLSRVSQAFQMHPYMIKGDGSIRRSSFR